MGREELALALKQRGEAEAKKIWQQAEAEAARYRSEKEEAVQRCCLDSDRESERNSFRECQKIAWQVNGELRAMRLSALRDLDRRLWALALDELARLDPERRQQCLDELTAEIPAGDWDRVVCHPGDRAALKKIFSDCRVEGDESVAGGLMVETAGRQVRIDNSLARRLKSLWPELTGTMLADLEGES